MLAVVESQFSDNQTCLNSRHAARSSSKDVKHVLSEAMAVINSFRKASIRGSTSDCVRPAIERMRCSSFCSMCAFWSAFSRATASATCARRRSLVALLRLLHPALGVPKHGPQAGLPTIRLHDRNMLLLPLLSHVLKICCSYLDSTMPMGACCRHLYWCSNSVSQKAKDD